MQRIVFALLALTLAIGADASNRHEDRFEKMKPDYYKFDYKYKNWRIIDNTVCDRYSGLEWKGCRRYANWFFSKKCWEYGYELRHKTGDVRRKLMKKKEMFCHAKRYITPLS